MLAGNKVVSLYRVVNDVENEVIRADKEWGDNNPHSHSEWLSLLVEEVGEAARELNEGLGGDVDDDKLYTELIQIAAGVVSWARDLKNGKVVE